MKKYAFLDQANTLYKGYSASDFYLYLHDQGHVGDWILENNKEMFDGYKSGRLSYSEASRMIVQLVADVVKEIYPEVLKKMKRQFMTEDRLFPYSVPLIKLLHEHGFKCIVISADPSPTVEALANFLELDTYYASELEKTGNEYTGKVLNVLNDEDKKAQVEKILSDINEPHITFGFGDSTGDIHMLSAVDHAFVVNSHQEELDRVAKEKGWNMVTSESILSKVEKVLEELQ